MKTGADYSNARRPLATVSGDDGRQESVRRPRRSAGPGANSFAGALIQTAFAPGPALLRGGRGYFLTGLPAASQPG